MNRLAMSTATQPLWIILLAASLTAAFSVPGCAAQSLQRGISVEMAVTSHAAAMPDADTRDALIVAITSNGGIYLGIDPIDPAALTAELKRHAFNKLYIKADARTPYASVAKVFDAARAAGILATAVLTAQAGSPQPGGAAPPKGLEVLLGPPLPSSSKSIVVQVLDSGQGSSALTINHKQVPWGSLESTVPPLAESRSEKVVLEKADGTVPFAQVVHVIDVFHSAGKVLLATAQP